MSEFFAVAGADQDSGLHVLTRPASSYQRGIESAMGLEVLRRGIVGDVLPELKEHCDAKSLWAATQDRGF